MEEGCGVRRGWGGAVAGRRQGRSGRGENTPYQRWRRRPYRETRTHLHELPPPLAGPAVRQAQQPLVCLDVPGIDALDAAQLLQGHTSPISASWLALWPSHASTPTLRRSERYAAPRSASPVCALCATPRHRSRQYALGRHETRPRGQLGWLRASDGVGTHEAVGSGRRRSSRRSARYVLRRAVWSAGRVLGPGGAMASSVINESVSGWPYGCTLRQTLGV